MMTIEEELYKRNLNKIEAYVKENSDRALSIIGDNEGAALSALQLSKNEEFIDSAMLSSYIRRGIIERKDDMYSLTELGLKVSSYYPLLGEKKDNRRAYDSGFFSFLLSFVQNKRLSSRRSSWVRYLQSDDVLKVFPRRDKERAKRAIARSVESFIRLGIVKDRDGFLTLDKNKAQSFMNMDEPSKLSYIADIEDKRGGAFAISLAFRIEGIKDRELDSYLKLIERISGLMLDKELLFDFEILMLDDGYISGATIEKRISEDAIFSSDFTLTYSGVLDYPLYLFLEAEKDDIVSQWRMTKESIKAAFDSGYDLEALKKIMNSICKAKLPDMLLRRLEGWWENYSKIKIANVLLLETDNKNARLIDRLDSMKEFIVAKPSETLYIMDSEREYEWREILISSGFDMLSQTKGEKACKNKADEVEFYGFSDFIELSDERAINYSAIIEKENEDSSENLIEKLLSQGGIRFSPSQHYEPSLVSGFCYTEKLSLILDAIKNSCNIYALLPDCREFTFTPISIERTEDDATAITEKGNRIPINIIYKAATIDRAVRAIV